MNCFALFGFEMLLTARGPHSRNKFLCKMMSDRVQIEPRRSLWTHHKWYAVYSKESSYFRKFWNFSPIQFPLVQYQPSSYHTLSAFLTFFIEHNLPSYPTLCCSKPTDPRPRASTSSLSWAATPSGTACWAVNLVCSLFEETAGQ